MAQTLASAESAWKSGVVAVGEGGAVLLVNPDSNSLSVVRFDPAAQLVAEIPVGRHPQTVATDRSQAFVANRGENTVAVVSLSEAKVSHCVEVGAEPFGVIAAQGRIYVSQEGESSVGVIDASDRRTLARIPTASRPRGLALSPDGNLLYVTHFQSGQVSIIDTEALQVLAVVDTSSGANVSQAVVLDPESRRAYLPQTLTNHQNPALVFDATVFPVVSVLDTPSQTHLRSQRIALDVADRPVGLPLDAVLHSSGRLYVVNAASNDVSVIDLASGKGVGHIEVGGNPRGLALSGDGQRLFVNNSLSGSLSVIDTAKNVVLEEFVVTRIPLPPAVLNGKRLFNSSDDTRMARDQWVACATCHFDGEADGRTWFFADGPRNTTSLLGLADTLPMHWSGDLDEIQDVESTIRALQAGTGLATGSDNCRPACDEGPPNSGRSQDLDDLADYMASLRIAPARLPVGTDMGAVQRGAAAFHAAETGCSECHLPPTYSDGRRHDVGTGDSPGERKGPFFDTPTLRGLARTAPYLHDGSAADLQAVLTTANPGNRHGRTSQLSATDVADLTAFLLALPVPDSATDPRSVSLCGLPVPQVFQDGFEALAVSKGW